MLEGMSADQKKKLGLGQATDYNYLAMVRPGQGVQGGGPPSQRGRGQPPRPLASSRPGGWEPLCGLSLSPGLPQGLVCALGLVPHLGTIHLHMHLDELSPQIHMFLNVCRHPRPGDM